MTFETLLFRYDLTRVNRNLAPGHKKISHRSLVHVVLLLSVRTILCCDIMLFPVVSSLQQVIKDVVYFYHKFEHFLLSDSLIDISPKK